MSYVFNDLEKSEILNAANVCKGLMFDSEDIEYLALKLTGASCAPCIKSYSILSAEEFLRLPLSIKKREKF
ncbi:hypothetical protein RCC30_06495 [Pseudomonas fluorescens]|nr:hypothetical protein RCC30_06495 [Pseudomonas fluorescens]